MARQRYSFDEKRIARFRKEGRGQGQGADYKPWLTVRDVPSRGRSHRPLGMTTGRVHHFLSDIEFRSFLLFDWAQDVVDIREQFPLDREATQRIADSMGVVHPCDVATRTPLVMTTDLVIDVERQGRRVILARAVKPAEELDKARVVEKLEIERRYWQEQEAEWAIITEREIPRTMADSIAWVHNYGLVDNLAQPYPGYFAEKGILLLREVHLYQRQALSQFAAEMDLRLSMETGTALMLVRHLIAARALTYPMDKPLDPTAPMALFTVPGLDQELAVG